MNNKAYLNYYQEILEKVSFDEALLTKEYHKAKQALGPSEHKALDDWMERKGLLRSGKKGSMTMPSGLIRVADNSFREKTSV